jgi:hypothetical protein
MDQHVRAAALRFAAKVALSVSAFACAPHVSFDPAHDGALDEDEASGGHGGGTTASAGTTSTGVVASSAATTSAATTTVSSTATGVGGSGGESGAGGAGGDALACGASAPPELDPDVSFETAGCCMDVLEAHIVVEEDGWAHFGADVANDADAVACCWSVLQYAGEQFSPEWEEGNKAYVWWECCMVAPPPFPACMAWGPPMPAELTDEAIRAWELAA